MNGFSISWNEYIISALNLLLLLQNFTEFHRQGQHILFSQGISITHSILHILENLDVKKAAVPLQTRPFWNLYIQTGKRCLHLHIPKRKNPHNRSSDKERKDCGDFLCRIHCFENDMQHFPDDAYISRRGFSGTDSSFRRHMRYMYRSEDCRRLHRWPRPSFLFRG